MFTLSKSFLILAMFLEERKLQAVKTNYFTFKLLGMFVARGKKVVSQTLS